MSNPNTRVRRNKDFDPDWPLPVTRACLTPRFGTRPTLCLVEDYAVAIQLIINGRKATLNVSVPAGYEFDASIPNVMVVRRLVGGPYDPQYQSPACLHDWLYQVHWIALTDEREFIPISRAIADQVWKIACRKCNVTEWRVQATYRSLRAFGGRAWPISAADREYIAEFTDALEASGRDIDLYRPFIEFA